MLSKSAETWDNSGAQSVLGTPAAPLTTSRAQEARPMADSERKPFCWPKGIPRPITRTRWVDPATRLWTQVTKQSDGCWLWTGRQDGVGYGLLHVDGRRTGAHRLAYRLTRGPIPDGLFVCHHCDVRLCVNPDHLFIGTAGDNMRDCLRKGRHRRGETNAYKTHCPAGHEYSEQNTHREAHSGWRKCRACHAARERERRKRARESNDYLL